MNTSKNNQIRSWEMDGSHQERAVSNPANENMLIGEDGYDNNAFTCISIHASQPAVNHQPKTAYLKKTMHPSIYVE